jgi:hypothetical protein
MHIGGSFFRSAQIFRGRILIKGDRKMSDYQDGYNKGYEDALSGQTDDVGGALFSLVSALTFTQQAEYENGYSAGYAKGKEELES